jgi:hypothetical protein
LLQSPQPNLSTNIILKIIVMKKTILAGFVAFCAILIPQFVHATYGQEEPWNLQTAVTGNSIKLTWQAPLLINSSDNGYAVLIQKDTPVLMDEIFSTHTLTPTFVPFGTTEYTFNDLADGKYYLVVGIGNCVPQQGQSCQWMAYSHWSDPLGGSDTQFNATVASSSASAKAPSVDDYSPSNFRSTVDGSTIHLAWDAPKTIDKSFNAYSIIITTNELNDYVYSITSADFNPYFEYFGTNQHNFYDQPTGTYYIRVALGKCDTIVRTTCKFSLIGGYAPSYVVEVKQGLSPDSPLFRTSSELCKNPPAHSFDCVDRYVLSHSQFTLSEERADFGCLEGFVKKGKDCVAGTNEGTTAAPTPKKSVGKPDLTISVSKASLVTRKVKGVAKKQYKIGVTVANKSTGDAAGDITYSFNGNAPIVAVKGSIKAHMSKKVFLYADTTEKGQKYVFTVDPGNAISETNESNNTATRVIGK